MFGPPNKPSEDVSNAPSKQNALRAKRKTIATPSIRMSRTIFLSIKFLRQPFLLNIAMVNQTLPHLTQNVWR